METRVRKEFRIQMEIQKQVAREQLAVTRNGKLSGKKAVLRKRVYACREMQGCRQAAVTGTFAGNEQGEVPCIK